MKVKGRFDNGDDRWLGMSNIPGEWAVGFHGLRRDVKESVRNIARTGF